MWLKLPKLQSVPFYPSSPLPQNNCKLTVLTFLTHLPAQPCPTASYEKLKTNRPNYFGRGVGVGGQTWQDLLHLFVFLRWGRGEVGVESWGRAPDLEAPWQVIG